MDPAATELSKLIGDVYDCTIEPDRWPSALQAVARFVQGDLCLLISEDAVAARAHVHYSSRDESAWLDAYFAKYIHLNPTLVPIMLNGKIGDIISSATFFPYKEFAGSRFFKEFIQPKGFVDVITAMLERSATSIAMLAVLRHKRDGLADEEAHDRMRLIAPHVRRAITIGRLLDLHRIEAAALTETLDSLAALVFLVDRRARIVHANESARGALRNGDLLQGPNGRLTAVDEEANSALREIFIAAADGDAKVGTKGIAVALKDAGGERYLAHVLPLTSGARQAAGAMYEVVAAVFIHKASLDVPSPLVGLVELYGLSPREMSVLLAIVETGGVPAVAALLGLTQATVKTYLKDIFEKTGAKRQADLVKLVAGLANPFAAPRR